MSQQANDNKFNRKGLWTHQVHAAEMIERFLHVRGASSGSSALVRMPTGTGKSGVIAVASQELLTAGDVLLLTPWDALVRQLTADVETDFWSTIKRSPPEPKKVLRIYPSTALDRLSSHSSPVIWTSTIATLQMLHASHSQAYAELRKRLRLVVVDEGHYEPALSWSDAVRGLGRPTVLFTATPYRNDAKYFHVDDEFSSISRISKPKQNESCER